MLSKGCLSDEKGFSLIADCVIKGLLDEKFFPLIADCIIKGLLDEKGFSLIADCVIKGLLTTELGCSGLEHAVYRTL